MPPRLSPFRTRHHGHPAEIDALQRRSRRTLALAAVPQAFHRVEPPAAGPTARVRAGVDDEVFGRGPHRVECRPVVKRNGSPPSTEILNRPLRFRRRRRRPPTAHPATSRRCRRHRWTRQSPSAGTRRHARASGSVSRPVAARRRPEARRERPTPVRGGRRATRARSLSPDRPEPPQAVTRPLARQVEQGLAPDARGERANTWHAVRSHVVNRGEPRHDRHGQEFGARFGDGRDEPSPIGGRRDRGVLLEAQDHPVRCSRFRVERIQPGAGAHRIARRVQHRARVERRERRDDLAVGQRFGRGPPSAVFARCSCGRRSGCRG